MVLAQAGGVAAVELGLADHAQAVDVLADQGAGLGALVDEQHAFGAARQRLEAQRAGAREQVEHAGALDLGVVAVGEQVEQAFAHPVGRGPQVRRGIALADAGQRRAAKLAADDAHQAVAIALRSDAGSAMASGAGETPPSIQRLPSM